MWPSEGGQTGSVCLEYCSTGINAWGHGRPNWGCQCLAQGLAYAGWSKYVKMIHQKSSKKQVHPNSSTVSLFLHVVIASSTLSTLVTYFSLGELQWQKRRHATTIPAGLGQYKNHDVLKGEPKITDQTQGHSRQCKNAKASDRTKTGAWARVIKCATEKRLAACLLDSRRTWRLLMRRSTNSKTRDFDSDLTVTCGSCCTVYSLYSLYCTYSTPPQEKDSIVSKPLLCYNGARTPLMYQPCLQWTPFAHPGTRIPRAPQPAVLPSPPYPLHHSLLLLPRLFLHNPSPAIPSHNLPGSLLPKKSLVPNPFLWYNGQELRNLVSR